MKLLVIFTGGTISCTEQGGALSPSAVQPFLLLERRPEISFDALTPFTVLSENMSAEHWKLLYDCIRSRSNGGYDGIIVAHGTDTLAYTAAFLSFSLGLCEVPVVLVSANYPLSDSRSNGFDNFEAAVSFIERHCGRGVFVSYRNGGDDCAVIHRGAELMPHAAYSDSVYSLFNNIYGTVKNGVFTANPDYTERFDDSLTGHMPGGTVVWLRAHVGMAYPVLSDGVKAVLLEGYHSGTLPTSGAELKDFCREAAEKNIPVYLTGCAPGFAYESKKEFKSLGIITLPPLSPAAAYVKLWLS